jgi:hypothetical protein
MTETLARRRAAPPPTWHIDADAVVVGSGVAGLPRHCALPRTPACASRWSPRTCRPRVDTLDYRPRRRQIVVDGAVVLPELSGEWRWPLPPRIRPTCVVCIALNIDLEGVETTKLQRRTGLGRSSSTTRDRCQLFGRSQRLRLMLKPPVRWRSNPCWVFANTDAARAWYADSLRDAPRAEPGYFVATHRALAQPPERRRRRR